MVPFAFSLGYLFDRFLMRPLANKKEHIRLMSSILVTLGAALCIEDVTSFLAGAEEKGVDYSLPSIFWGDIYISYLRLLAMVMIAALTVGIHYYLKKTFTGRALRATTQNLRVPCWSAWIPTGFDRSPLVLALFLPALQGSFMWCSCPFLRIWACR